jgi:hypothetical protein
MLDGPDGSGGDVVWCRGIGEAFDEASSRKGYERVRVGFVQRASPGRGVAVVGLLVISGYDIRRSGRAAAVLP